MSLSIGIVGLPNVGKSTLFNVLTQTRGAQAENFPFCTIDPNVGVVEVPDPKLDILFNLVKPKKRVPSIIEFVDIAGLVRNASKGEGLGNQFLANIRDTDAILIVLRFFINPDIIHVENSIDPKRDYEIIATELIIKDLETVKSRLDKARSQAKGRVKEDVAEAELLEKLNKSLEEGKLAFEFLREIDQEDSIKTLKSLHLLTAKPFIIACNVSENELAGFDTTKVRSEILTNIPDFVEIVPFSAKIEEELIGMTQEEKFEFLASFGVPSGGLDRLIVSCFSLLGLQNFYTAGEEEVRAWTVKKLSRAPQAAGVIHTDFEKGFIKAEIVSFDDFTANSGWKGAKEKGRVRLEGKDYIMKPDDVVIFKFNV